MQIRIFLLFLALPARCLVIPSKTATATKLPTQRASTHNIANPRESVLTVKKYKRGKSPISMTDRPLQIGSKGAYIVRILMVGDSACGKTSLVLRFDQNVFSTKFVTTIGVDYRDKVVKVRHCRVKQRVGNASFLL